MGNEAAHLGPEVSLVRDAATSPGGAEGLAGARAGPDAGVVGDAGKSERVAPSSDPGEEVDLLVPHKVSCPDIGNAPLVHVAGSDVPARDELAQPGRREGVDFVVVGAHNNTSQPIAA